MRALKVERGGLQLLSKAALKVPFFHLTVDLLYTQRLKPVTVLKNPNEKFTKA